MKKCVLGIKKIEIQFKTQKVFDQTKWSNFPRVRILNPGNPETIAAPFPPSSTSPGPFPTVLSPPGSSATVKSARAWLVLRATFGVTFMEPILNPCTLELARMKERRRKYCHKRHQTTMSQSPFVDYDLSDSINTMVCKEAGGPWDYFQANHLSSMAW